MHAKALIILVYGLALQIQTASPSNAPSEGIELRYARAQIQLAEANLRRVEESNKRLERSVPSSVVAEYKRDLHVATTRLQQAAKGGSSGEFPVWLKRAEAEQAAAFTAWKNAVDVNRRVPGTYVPLDVERFRLRAEVARLQLERGQSLVDSNREAQLQWQIDLLDNQVQRLKEESGRETPFIGFYPSWWW